jgi:hypothetical protein
MNATLRPAEYPRRRPRTMIVLATLFLIAVPLTWTGGHALGSSQDESDRTDLRQKRHYGDLINIFTGDIRIPADTIRHGSIICIGGDVVVEGEVSQDVIVILGGVKMDGTEARSAGVSSESFRRWSFATPRSTPSCTTSPAE